MIFRAVFLEVLILEGYFLKLEETFHVFECLLPQNPSNQSSQLS